jgi:hypothetical protein
VSTGGSSEKFRIAPNQVQIDTTHFRPQHHVKSAVSATNFTLNRTAVNDTMKKALLSLAAALATLTAAGSAMAEDLSIDDYKKKVFTVVTTCVTNINSTGLNLDGYIDDLAKTPKTDPSYPIKESQVVEFKRLVSSQMANCRIQLMSPHVKLPYKVDHRETLSKLAEYIAQTVDKAVLARHFSAKATATWATSLETGYAIVAMTPVYR